MLWCVGCVVLCCVVLCVHVVLCVSLFLHVSFSFCFSLSFFFTARTETRSDRQVTLPIKNGHAPRDIVSREELSTRTHSFEHRHTRTALNKHTNTTNQEHQIFTTPTAKKQHINSHAKHTHTNTNTNTTTQKQTRNKRNQQRHPCPKTQYKP